MKSPPDKDDEMPSEIDFTGGIRGKYAARYREGVTVRELPPIDPIGFYETQSRLGYALWHTQAFESTLVAYYCLLFELTPTAAGTEASSVLESGGGRLLHELRQQAAGSHGFSHQLGERLERFLRERNWLVHRSRYDLESGPGSLEGRRALSMRLESLADEAQYLNEKLAGLLENQLVKRGLSPSEIRTQAREAIDRWAAA